MLADAVQVKPRRTARLAARKARVPASKGMIDLLEARD